MRISDWSSDVCSSDLLYAMAFVTRASAAKIAAPSYSVAMPRDGTFFNLVPTDGIVHKGQPLGSFQAAMLDVVQTDIGALHLSPEQLSQLMGDQLKGTLTRDRKSVV